MSDRKRARGRARALPGAFLLACSLWAVAPAVSPTCAAAAPSVPTRIVSTSPSITETLFALGLGNRVIAVSNFCRFPPQVLALPKIGTFLKPDFERIVTLKPDLVVVSDKAGDLSKRLVAAHIPSVDVPGATLSDVTSAMLRIGAAAGVEPHAREVAGAIERRLDNVRRRPAVSPRPKVLLILGRNPESLTGMIAVGKGTYLDDLLAIAGGINVFDDPGGPPYPNLSLENVLHLDPDIIVDMIDMSAPEDVRARRAAASPGLWQGLRTIAAVRNGHVEAAAIDALVVPGPRVVDAAEWLADLIRRPSRP